jgi:hypothetical protein
MGTVASIQDREFARQLVLGVNNTEAFTIAYPDKAKNLSSVSKSAFNKKKSAVIKQLIKEYQEKEIAKIKKQDKQFNKEVDKQVKNRIRSKAELLQEWYVMYEKASSDRDKLKCLEEIGKLEGYYVTKTQEVPVKLEDVLLREMKSEFGEDYEPGYFAKS